MGLLYWLMGRPWAVHVFVVAHGLPIEIQWKFHGSPVRLLWESHGTPVGIPWDTHEVIQKGA